MKLSAKILKQYQVKKLIRLVDQFPNDPILSGRFLLANYTEAVQFNKVLWDEVTLQCRGLVYDTQEEKIIGRCLGKFFNLCEYPDNWNNFFTEPVIEEKMDGSMILLHWNEILNRWVTSTRGNFCSDQAMAAERLISSSVYKDYVAKLDKSISYIFEYIGRNNVVVVKYDTERLVLLATLNTLTGEEYSPRETEWPHYPRQFQLDWRNVESCEYLDSLIGNTEGFVLKWNGNSPGLDVHRAKLKLDWYLKSHRLKADFTPKRLLEMAKLGPNESRLAIAQLPDEFYTEAEVFLNKYYSEYYLIESTCQKLVVGGVMNKEIADHYKSHGKYSSVLFRMHRGQSYDQELHDVLDLDHINSLDRNE